MEFAINHEFLKIAIPIIDFINMPNRNHYIKIARKTIRNEICKTEKDVTVYLLLTDINNDYCQDIELEENIYEKIESVYDNTKNIDINQIEANAKNELSKYNEYLNKKNDYVNLFKQNSDLKYSDEYYDFIRSFQRFEFKDFDYSNKKQYSDDDYLEFYYDYLLYRQKHNRFTNRNDYRKIENETNIEDLTYWDENEFWEYVNSSKFHFELDLDGINKKRKNNEKILKKLSKDLKINILHEEKLEAYRRNIKEETFYESISLKSENLHEEIQSLFDKKEESFSQMVLRKIVETGRNRVTCYKAANVNKNIFSKIVKDANGDENDDGTPFIYKPDKKIVFAFAIALRLKIDEANELLRKAGYAFAHYPQDIIVKSFIEKGIYDIDIVNQFLFKFNQPLLGTTSRE